MSLSLKPIGKAWTDVKIIDWLEPLVRDLQRWKVGWLIPIGLIFVLSFPPLFGNGASAGRCQTSPSWGPPADLAEIVILLVGVVWGLARGTGIVSFRLPVLIVRLMARWPPVS